MIPEDGLHRGLECRSKIKPFFSFNMSQMSDQIYFRVPLIIIQILSNKYIQDIFI